MEFILGPITAWQDPEKNFFLHLHNRYLSYGQEKGTRGKAVVKPLSSRQTQDAIKILAAKQGIKHITPEERQERINRTATNFAIVGAPFLVSLV